MNRIFSVLIIFGIIVWGFLMWDRVQPEERAHDIASEFDDANTTDRCAEFRMTEPEVTGEDNDDESVWSLGYKGRIKQLLNGCF